jgi:SSS family solute:Na+ symporter
MTPSAVALSVILAIVVLGSALGLYAGTRYKMDLEQWTVAGRGFGLLFVWLLMAGESYTTFSLLGASGWAYSQGGPALYILAYMMLVFVVSFYIIPPIWEIGRQYSLQTQSDFFQQRYNSKSLAVVVALVGLVFMIPYLQLQLTGLGIIVEVASFEGISRAPAMLIAFVLVASFVFVSGIRAVAWISVLKDLLLLFVVATVGIAVPKIYFGGVGPMFSALMRSRPTHLTMPGATVNHGHAWFISTVLLTSLGGYIWPHTMGSCFTAKSSNTLRRNAVIMPLYGMTVPLVFLVGFSGILIVPGLKNGDLSLLTVVRKTFSPRFLGIVGGAGALTAMVPAALQILTAATLFAKNVYRPLFAPHMSDQQVARLGRAMVLVIAATALYFAIYSSTTLVGLLLIGYAGITQLFPGIVLGLFSRRVSSTTILCGLVVGVVTVATLILGNHDPFFGLNAGFVALCLNFLTVGVLNLARSSSPAPPPETASARATRG